MALEKEEVEQLKADLKKILSKTKGQFLYCPAGKNGDPILVLSAKKITMGQVKTVREKARVKTFVRGRVSFEAGESGKELVFYTKADPPGKLVKHVKQFFGRSVTKLKKAIFKKIEVEDQNVDEPNEFAEEGDITTIQDENASFSEFDNKNTAEIQNAIAKLDHDKRRLQRQRQMLIEKSEELQYKVLVEGKKAFRSREEMAEAEKQAAELREQADRLGLQLEANLAKGDEAHAQLQNRFAEEREADYERRLSAIDKGIDDDILKRFLEEEAEKEEAVAQRKAEIADMQTRLELLREQERSQLVKLEERRSKVNGKITETGDVVRGNRLLEKIREAQEELVGNLQSHRLDVDLLQAEYLLSHAMSDRMMDKFDTQVREHWATLNSQEDQEYYQTKVQSLMDSEEPYHNARKNVRNLENELEQTATEASRLELIKISMEQDIRDLTAETAESDARMLKIQERLLKAEEDEDSAKIERFTLRQAKENDRQKEYRARIQEKREELKKCNARITELNDGLPGKKTSLSEARDALKEEQRKRDEILLSESERATVQMIAAREEGALAKAKEAKEALALKKQQAAAAQAKVSNFKKSEKEFQRVNALLVAKLAEFERQKELAGKWKLPWRNKKNIESARAELPALEAEIEILRKQFNDARTDFEGKKANYSNTDIEAAFTAEQDILKLEKEAAEADALALEMMEQRLQNETQMAAMTHDIYEQRLDNTKGLLINNIEGFKTKFDTAQHELAEKEAEFEKQSTILIDHEIALADLKKDLNTPMSISDFNNKLAAIGEQEERVKNARDALEATQQAVSEKEEAIDTLNEELRTEAESVKGEQTEKGSIARHYLQSLVAVQNSSEDEEDILTEAVSVHDEHEQAEIDRNNAQRKAGLIESNQQVALAIHENRGLIEKFHKITGDETGKAYDLLNANDRKELKKNHSRGYEKLKAFTSSLEELSLSMIAKGASLEELQNAFAEVPNGLRPASFREEVARFHQVERLLEEEQNETNVLQEAHAKAIKNRRPEQIKKSIQNGLEAIKGALGDINDVNSEIEEAIGSFVQNYDSTEVIALKGFTGEEVASNNETIQAIDDFVGNATAVFGLASSVSETGQAIYNKYANQDIMDPIEKKMANDKLLDSLLGLGEQTVNSVKQFGSEAAPGLGVLGVILKSEEMMKSIVEASSRRILAARDSMLQEAAKLASSPMASALEETKVQERQLFIKYGIKAATSAVGIAADLMSSFPGPQQAIGAALNVVTWLTDKAVSLKLYMVKKKQIQEARNLLRRAKKGDAEAKNLLFQHHAVYAKGLIAAMALERDSFAMTYVQSRGLSDSEIQASSFKIISRYLLDKAEQSSDEFDIENEDNKWAGRMVAFRKVINWIANVFKKPAYEMEADGRIDQMKDFYTKVSELDNLHDHAVSLLPKLKQKRDELIAKGSTNQTYVKQVEEVNAYIVDHKEVKKELRTHLIEWGTKVANYRQSLDIKNNLDDEEYDALTSLEKERHRISKVIVPILEQFVQETARAAV